MEAYRAREGMELDPQDLRKPHHVVRDVDVRDNGIMITSNHGRWLFHPLEPLAFPRHDDGWFGRLDYREDKMGPRVENLRVHDILPGYSTMTNPTFDQNVQHVVRVVPRPDFKALHLFVRSEATKPYRWTYAYGETVQFPKLGSAPDRDPVPIDDDWPKYVILKGPYRDLADGTSYMFAEHPYGRGRWPRALTEGIRLPCGHMITRPPTNRQAWSGYSFHGGRELAQERHRRDPLYNVRGSVGQAPTDDQLQFLVEVDQWRKIGAAEES